MLKAFSLYLAGKTRFKDAEVILYGLLYLLETIIGAVVVITVALICDCLTTTLTVSLAVLLLRTFAGGAHCKSLISCTLANIIIFPLLGKASLYLQDFTPFVFLTGIFSTLLIWKLAPVGTPNKPILTLNHRNRLKRLSILSTSILMVFYILLVYQNRTVLATSICLGIFWEAVLLSSGGNLLMALIDGFVIKFMKGGDTNEKNT